MSPRTRSRSRTRRGIALAATIMLAVAACGDDDEEEVTDTTTGGAATTSAGTAGPDTTETGSTAAETSGPETSGDDGDGASTTVDGDGAETTVSAAGCPEIDTSIDELWGEGAGRLQSDLMCANETPLVAEGDPIVVGFQTAEGDPNGSFPEYALAAQAAVEYINNELGGLGADIQNGVAGRPIELEVCTMAISPDDSQRCANEIVGADPFVAFSSINFFGNNLPILTGAGIPTIVVTPITIADFTTEGVYAITGGCLGNHTGMVEFATTEFGDVTKVAVPWADTPPGVVCYYDLEAKPLDVLNGTVEGTGERAGSMPDLEHIGVPIKPATPDVTAQVSEILEFEPDVIMFSAQGADCWNLVGGLGRLGWTPEDIPLVLASSCIDFEAMEDAGELAVGAYFVGGSTAILNPPDSIEDERTRFQAEIYQTKAADYGLPGNEMEKGFAAQAFVGMMSLWEVTSRIVSSGEELTPESITEAYAATDGDHMFGSAPMSCSTAPPPYVAVCNGDVEATQWDGEQLVVVRDRFTGVDLVAGTEFRTGP